MRRYRSLTVQLGLCTESAALTIMSTGMSVFDSYVFRVRSDSTTSQYV
jgi:hypothetical protein